MSFDIKHWKSEFYYLRLGIYPSLTEIVEALKTLIKERHNHSGNYQKHRKAQKSEIYLASEETVLAFFSADMGHTFEVVLVMLVMNLLWCWDEKNLTNQSLLMISSTSTLSGYTRTWLSSMSLAIRRLNCCVTFLSFQSSNWRQYNYWTLREMSDI